MKRGEKYATTFNYRGLNGVQCIFTCGEVLETGEFYIENIHFTNESFKTLLEIYGSRYGQKLQSFGERPVGNGTLFHENSIKITPLWCRLNGHKNLVEKIFN